VRMINRFSLLAAPGPKPTDSDFSWFKRNHRERTARAGTLTQ
jgi:hypothetical protein